MPTNENTNLFPALLLRLDDVQDLSVLGEAGRTLGFGLGEAFEAMLKEIEAKLLSQQTQRLQEHQQESEKSKSSTPIYRWAFESENLSVPSQRMFPNMGTYF